MSRDEILLFLEEHQFDKKGIDKKLKCSFPLVYESIFRLTSFLPLESKTAERVYCIKNEIHDRKVCPVCGVNPLKFNPGKNRYRFSCSIQCTNKNPRHISQVRETLHKQQQQISEKKAKTCLKKYGGRAPAASDEVKNKAKDTRLHRYGSATYNNREQAKKTCLDNYGVDNVFKIDKNRNAVKNALQEKSYNEKVTNPIFSTIPLFSIDDYKNRKDPDEKLKFKCTICGNVFWTKHTDGKHNRCPLCFPEDWNSTSRSGSELELFQFIEDSCKDIVEHSNRKILHGKEIDIYVPSKKLAIEYDGLFWHNEHYKPAQYHLEKTEQCEINGIQLIHVFEDEWLSKKDIVKSKLQDLLGSYKKALCAQDCCIKEVDQLASIDFQNENHIQGSEKSDISIGLHYNGCLVSLMTFRRCRCDEKFEWELLRFCNKIGHHINGAGETLLRFFERGFNPMSIVCCIDRRWSQGEFCKALGFHLEKTNAPDYWYFNTNTKRISRMSLQASLPQNSSATEASIAIENGYYRIFDCGSLIFVKEMRK